MNEEKGFEMLTVTFQQNLQKGLFFAKSSSNSF